jgi:succinyl-diaminopimelate desuccinylase
MKEAIASLLHQLVAIPSVDGRPAEKKSVLTFVRDWLEANGVTTEWQDHPSQPSLIATVRGDGAPLLLLTHVDVVPAPETLFRMRREGDRVFGRGVIDDKGPASVLMLLLAEIARSNEPHTAVKAVFSTDEEIGSADGVERLVSEGLLGGNRCVIALDGGDETSVVRREKGLLHLTLQAKGKAAHNSTPWEGDNAVEKMLRTYARLKEALHEETTDADRWKTTVSIGTIQGGQFVNQTPGHCEARIDIRFTEKHTLDAVTEAVKDALEPGVGILGAQGGHPFETPENDPLLRQYVGCMGDAIGKPVRLVSEHGATDARFFRGMNVPIWLHYPAGGDLHTDDEWMDLASAEKLLRGLIAFVHRVSP